MSDIEFASCTDCGTERVASTLSHSGVCPFCLDTQNNTAPPPAPEPTPRVRISKAKDKAVTGIPATLPDPRDNDVRRLVQDLVAPPAIEPYVPPKFDTTAAANNPEREMASRILCRRRLLPFIKRFRPKYQAGWVHEDICRRLERFVKDVELGKEPRLLLMMPPRGGKSEIGSRNFPPWVLGQHPDWEIIAASHTGSLTMSFSRYIRDLLRDPAYQVLFPDARLDPSSQSVENWNLTGGGGYLAAGVGTGITGRGAHILLLDDLVKDIEAADSPTIKENTWEWYISTAYSRLAPGGGVLGIMTWWSEDDWAGRIQQVMKMEDGGDQFEIVRYPALNEEGDEYILTDDTIVEIPPGSPVPEGARMTRPMDTALHPARYTTAALKRIKKNYIAGGLKRMWQSLYQQNPTPDDGIYFNREMLRYYGHRPPRLGAVIYQAWDFAITEETQNDWTVCATILQDERDDLYVLNVLRFKSDDGNAIVDHIIDNSLAWKADLLGFEDGQIWKTMAAQFTKRCQERKHYPAFEILVPLTDKLVRATPLKGRMQMHKVHFPKDEPWVEVCVRELMTFPGGKHDDQVDALAWAVRLTLTKSAPKRAAPPPVKSWKDKLRALGGTRGGAMAA